MDDEMQVGPIGAGYCASCGKRMRGLIGMKISLIIDIDDGGESLALAKEQLGIYADLLVNDSRLDVSVCWECWLKSLGVKAPNQDRRSDND